MAKRISQLPEETSVATEDQVPIYDASTGTTKRATVTNMLAGVKDGTLISNDAILARHINWAGTGADGGIWWEELGRTTLGSAGDTITVSGLPVRKYLHILYFTIATGGTNSVRMTVNGDTGNNYSYNYRRNADTTSTSGNSVASFVLDTGTGAWNMHGTLEVVNIAAQEKPFIGMTNALNTVGAGANPGRIEFGGKWSNTSNAISSVTLTNTGSGDFAIGSELVILGHD